MSQTPSPQTLVAKCPHCRKSYTVRPEHIGRTTQCKQCGQSFEIAPVETAAAVAPAAAAHDPHAILCPVCQSPISEAEAPKRCGTCNTAHHADCWEYNRGCGLYGCKESPETEKLQEIEIPASYWGQTQKACPNCGKVIQAAAVRCRHCGTTFETARPQESAEFEARRQQKESQVLHKRIGITLLVLAVIPCTAPLAAVFGIIWYLSARRAIAALPPLHATICRLAVGIAVAVTLLLVIIGVAFSGHSGSGPRRDNLSQRSDHASQDSAVTFRS